MDKKSISDELRILLRPFIKEHPLKKDTVLDEDVENLIDFAQAFGVENELLETVKANPNGVFWDFLNVIPEGLAPDLDEADLADILYDE